MTYETLREFGATWGLAYLMVLFAGVLIYALWPGNGNKFERAARMPLEEE